MVVEYSNHDSFSQAVQLLCPMGCGYKMLSLQVPSAPLRCTLTPEASGLTERVVVPGGLLVEGLPILSLLM